MAAIGSRHAACVKRLIALLTSRTAGDAIVSAQDPVQLPDYSEPEPDVALLRPSADFYATSHPTPDDVLSRPEDGAYRRTRIVGRGESIALEKMPGLTVEVEEILG